MRDLAIGIGLAIVAIVVILLIATKVVPLLEDLRVVEPTDGVQCAIVSRVAEVSIDCWKKDKEMTRAEEIGDDYGADVPYNQGGGIQPLVIRPTYPPGVPNVAGGKRQAEIEKSIGNGEGLLIEGLTGSSSFTVSNMGNLYWRGTEDSITPTTTLNAVTFACGTGKIEIDYGTAEAIFTEGCNPSEASKEIWEGIRPYFDMDIRRGLYLKMNPPEVS